MIFKNICEKFAIYIKKRKLYDFILGNITKFTNINFSDLLLITGILILSIGLFLPWIEIGGFPSKFGFLLFIETKLLFIFAFVIIFLLWILKKIKFNIVKIFFAIGNIILALVHYLLIKDLLIKIRKIYPLKGKISFGFWIYIGGIIILIVGVILLFRKNEKRDLPSEN